MPFPQFNDGDVEIRFTQANDETYVLHSHALALHSSWFKASLSERWRQRDSAASTPGKRHVFELRFDEGSHEGFLVRESSGDSTEMLRGIDAPRAEATLKATKYLHKRRIYCLRAHQAMLGALYHVAPTTADATTAGLKSLAHIARTADYYNCGGLVKLHIHACLRQHNEKVLGQCQTDPETMIRLGLTFEADWIVKESAAYIICSDSEEWDYLSPRLEHGDAAEIHAALCEKRTRFLDVLKDTELGVHRMGSGYSYCRGTAGQVGLDMFRQWFGDTLGADSLSWPHPFYAAVFHEISVAITPRGLPTSTIQHHGGPYTYNLATGWEIETGWSTAWENAKKLVKPLMKDVTQLKSRRDRDTDLRFITLDDDDLPWIKK